MRRDLPTGTMTFLFTDVEASTALLRELGETTYAETLAGHRRILRRAIADHAGIEVDTEGDAIFAAFPTAIGAVSAACDAQAAFGTGPVRVRMGLHTGTPLRTEEGYVGIDVHRAARIAAAGHGRQVLVSSTTAALLAGGDVALTDLGVHRLRGIEAGERIHQVGTDAYPPLRSLSPTNLPAPAGGLVGRGEELVEIGELLRDPQVRLLSLVGAGGIGKTRLALEAAADLAGSFPDGRWWVPLGSHREAEAALGDIGGLLGLAEGAGAEAVREQLADRRTLIALDNAEHLLPDLAGAVAAMLPTAGASTILVTSREPLHLEAERVVRVPALDQEAAERLLIGRAAALGVTVQPSAALTILAARLDRLPLALTLAASRLTVLSVEQLVERLTQRLDLFAGARDADPRQRTLRATIEWSHDLLTDAERTLFRRLAVFAGGWTLEAAEAVADAELDLLQGLVDRSIVVRTDGMPRFEMLESIRQFAAEQLAASDEERAVRERHATWIRALAEGVDERLHAGEPEEQWVPLLNPELDNLRAAVAHGLEVGDTGTVRGIAAALPYFWVMRGRVAEGRAWIERALEVDPARDATRLRLLSGLAILAYSQGDLAVSTEIADDAAALAIELGPAVGRYAALRAEALAALAHGDLATAEALYEQMLVVAREDDNGVGMSACRINMAGIANRTGRHARAEALMTENLPFVRGRGQARCEATTLVTLAETMVWLDRPTESVDYALAAAEVAPRTADATLLLEALRWYAAAIARLGDAARAARIVGACEAAEAGLEVALEPYELAARGRLLVELAAALTDAGLETERSAGRQLDLAAAAALIREPLPMANAPAAAGARV